jgi:catechol 2,3-dioxygenase-like lactoylglutathione lyase family enzyme
MSEPRRMQLTGLHHLTLITTDMERSIGFYRDVLGLGIIRDGASDDDPGVRHVWFGAIDGAAGRLVSVMEYPTLPEGVVGTGSTHHFALAVDSSEELAAWRDYLRDQGVESTDVFHRGGFESIYLRDPDGHVIEIATRPPVEPRRDPGGVRG